MCQCLLFSITIACIISHEKALKLLTNKKLIEILTNLYEAHLQVKNVTIYITKIFLWPLFLNISAKFALNAQQLHTSIKYLLGLLLGITTYYLLLDDNIYYFLPI